MGGLLWTGRVLLSSAFFADAINLERVAGGEVVIFLSDFLLKLTDFLGKELHRAAAVGANHVVMAAPIVLVLIAGNAIMKGDFAGESTFGEQLERAINSGIADTRIFFLHQAMKFVGREMVAGFKESAQNRIALRRLLEANLLQMAVQNVLRLAHHLARQRGLIVDTLLQHG